MTQIKYQPKGVCSREFDISIDENNVIRKINIKNGCAGNTQGVSRLCEGMEASEVVKRLKGINCGARGTSCPDQLATALEEYLKNN